jgi:hypothetical protein
MGRPIAARNQNTVRHEPISSNPDPMSGAAIGAMTPSSSSMVNCWARRVPWVWSATTARERTVPEHAAHPCSTRNASRKPGPGATAHSADATT